MPPLLQSVSAYVHVRLLRRIYHGTRLVAKTTRLQQECGVTHLLDFQAPGERRTALDGVPVCS